MTKSVGVHEANIHLSRLLQDVGAGEEVVITSRGREVARLVAPRRAREFGSPADASSCPTTSTLR